MSTTPAAQSAAAAAGDLLDVAPWDRAGTLVRSDGTLVRYYELIPQNPEVLAQDQQEVMIVRLGQCSANCAPAKRSGIRRHPAAPSSCPSSSPI